MKFTPTDSLLFTTNGPRLGPGAWCSICRDGDDVVICTTCKVNSICTLCIEFNFEDPETENFECPACFIKRSPHKSYRWRLNSRGAGRENLPKVITTPLAIIAIHLQGMTDRGSVIVYHHLAEWLQGNLVLVDLTFNFDDPNNQFESNLDTMLESFETGDFKEWTRFLVVITTHSDPETGYLHIAPGHTASAPVDELFNFMFPERFHNILKRSPTNILSLLSCGALSNQPESREMIKQISSTNLFDKVLCFSQRNLQTAFTHKFLMDLALNQFVFDRMGITNTLRDHQALGAHTDIILFRPGIIQTFRWTHPGARPMGHDTSSSLQCPKCSRLNTISPKFLEMDSTRLRCSSSDCRWEETYCRPTHFNWCQNESPRNKEERGAWLYSEEKEGNNKSMDVA